MSAMARAVEPEWLDTLPPDDPRAVRSRADLRRVNVLMGNARIVAGLVRGATPGPLRRVAEIGAGDGTFALRVARALGANGKAEMVLVDRLPIVEPATRNSLRALGWECRAEAADVFDWLDSEPAGACDAIFANLFLHHFADDALDRLLAAIAARTRAFVACEPRRSALALAGSHGLAVLGCNDVTRHDAVASVRAGFAGRELAARWPAPEEWRIEERARGLFSHAFVATRR